MRQIVYKDNKKAIVYEFSIQNSGEGHRKPKKKDYGHRKPIAVTESHFEKARSQKATFGFTKKPI